MIWGKRQAVLLKQIKDAQRAGNEHRGTMSLTARHASCSSSLRQTLLQGWQQTFPMHPSPFRQMAARSGATPQELLSVCQGLHRSGALLSIRPRWGEGLRRERWRLSFAANADDTGLAPALAALPGCARLERAEPQAGLPLLWAEVEALDADMLERQLQRLPVAPSARLRLPIPAVEGALPCDDPELARRLEEGLPVCSRPFAECSKELGRSEHRLLAKLLAWRRGRQLEGLALKPPPTRAQQSGALALWRDVDIPATALQFLQSKGSVDGVIPAERSREWPWRLSLVVRATPELALDKLRELAAEAGLPAPDQLARLQILEPRDQALLFHTDAGDPPLPRGPSALRIGAQPLDRCNVDGASLDGDQAALFQFPQHP